MRRGPAPRLLVWPWLDRGADAKVEPAGEPPGPLILAQFRSNPPSLHCPEAAHCLKVAHSGDFNGDTSAADIKERLFFLAVQHKLRQTSQWCPEAEAHAQSLEWAEQTGPESPDSGFLSHYVAVTPHPSLPGGLGPGIRAGQCRPRTCQEGPITCPLHAGP